MKVRLRRALGFVASIYRDDFTVVLVRDFLRFEPAGCGPYVCACGDSAVEVD